MSVSYSALDDVIVVLTTEDFGLDDLKNAFTELRDEFEGKALPPILVDDPGSNFQPSADTLRRVMDMWATLFAEASPRIALLVTKQVHYGLGRMLTVYAEERGVTFLVFLDREEAMTWLRAPNPAERASVS